MRLIILSVDYPQHGRLRDLTAAFRTRPQEHPLVASGEQTRAALDAEEKWRTAIEHAAGCLPCRTPGAACETGEALLATYNRALREGGRAAQ